MWKQKLLREFGSTEKQKLKSWKGFPICRWLDSNDVVSRFDI